MASMAGYQPTTSAVKQLATAIKGAQDPGIKQMSAWLTSWGKPVRSPSHGGHNMFEMLGLMTEDQMSELGNTDGTMFDRMWRLSSRRTPFHLRARRSVRLGRRGRQPTARASMASLPSRFAAQRCVARPSVRPFTLKGWGRNNGLLAR
jgi:hypothetical protein